MIEYMHSHVCSIVNNPTGRYLMSDADTNTVTDAVARTVGLSMDPSFHPVRSVAWVGVILSPALWVLIALLIAR